jgi:CRP/FNR family transcriptional regulator, cyclic AMP receptor protein
MASGGLDNAATLRLTALFSTAADETLTQLSAASRVRALPKGAMLTMVGDDSRSVWVVLTGLLRVFVTSFNGDEPTLGVLAAGDYVGELGVLDSISRSASIGALRASEVLEIPAAAFLTAYRDDPAIARQLVHLLAERLRSTSSSFADLTYLDLGGRLAKYLIASSARSGKNTITLELTQGELGQMLGGARQTVNQLMQSLERAGLISVDGRTIRLVDLEGLRLRSLSAL